MSRSKIRSANHIVNGMFNFIAHAFFHAGHYMLLFLINALNIVYTRLVLKAVSKSNLSFMHGQAIKLAIVGATGAVGGELLQVLEKRYFPTQSCIICICPLAGKRSFRGKRIAVQALSEASFEGIDIAIFSAGSNVARQWVPNAIQQGAQSHRQQLCISHGSRCSLDHSRDQSPSTYKIIIHRRLPQLQRRHHANGGRSFTPKV